MQLYEKIDGQLVSTTAKMLLKRAAGDYLVYDLQSGEHFLYQVKICDEQKQLFRSPIDGNHSVLRQQFRYDVQNDQFGTSPLDVDTPLSYSPPNEGFLTQEEVHIIKGEQKIEQTPQADDSEDWYISDSPLTREQQQQLYKGSVHTIPTPTFAEYMERLVVDALEASIHSANADKFPWSFVLAGFRYTYFNPRRINHFSRLSREAHHPTLGEIFDYYVQVTKKYIIKLHPEKAEQLTELKASTSLPCHSSLIGTLQDEDITHDIEKIYHITPEQDKLFQAAALIIGAEASGFDSTMASILGRDDFKELHAKIFELLYSLIYSGYDLSSSFYKEYYCCIHLLKSVYHRFSNYTNNLTLNNSTPLIDACNYMLSSNKELLSYILDLMKIPVEYRDSLLLANNPCCYIQILTLLHEEKMINRENCEAAAKHTSAPQVSAALIILKRERMLNQENFKAVMEHTAPMQLLRALKSMDPFSNGQEKQEICKAVLKSRTPHQLQGTVELLRSARINNPENREAVFKHNDHYAIYYAIYVLGDELRNQKNFDAVIRHTAPNALHEIVCLLQNVRIFNQEKFDAVIRHPQPASLAEIIKLLRLKCKPMILNQENFEAVIRYPEPTSFEKTLTDLAEAKNLSQASFLEALVSSTAKGLEAYSVSRPSTFTFLQNSRNLNADINRKVAKALLLQLKEARRVPEISVILSPSNVEKTRRTIIREGGYRHKTGYVERVINSKTLNQLIATGQQAFPEVMQASVDMKRARIKLAFETYIERVKDNETFGLTLFCASRARYRWLNWNLADKIVNRIDKLATEDEIAQFFTEENVRSLRQEVISDGKNADLKNRDTNSTELAAAFELAREYFPTAKKASAVPTAVL